MSDHTQNTNQAEYLDDPGYNLPNRDQLHTIACRLIHQTREMIAGITPDGKRTGKSYHKGTLSIQEAVYAVQYALSRGLSPFGDIHIWWYKQLQVCEHYRILAGWAQLRQPYVDSYRPIEEATERKRHQLKQGDIAAVCYILKQGDRELLLGCLQAGLDRWQALEMAATVAIGIVAAQEMTDSEGRPRAIDVKGWSWLQRAETRALRNALGRSHGTPTPAEIIAYSRQFNPGLSPAILTHRDFDPSLPPDVQRRLMGQLAHEEQHAAEWANLSPEERKAQVAANVIAMRGPVEEGID